MLNQIVLVGRLTKKPELKEDESERKFSYITLAVTRCYKNYEGIYETDFIDCILWNSVAQNTCEYCNKNDIVGIKGRLETHDGKLCCIAEKVTFLSNRKEEEKGE